MNCSTTFKILSPAFFIVVTQSLEIRLPKIKVRRSHYYIKLSFFVGLQKRPIGFCKMCTAKRMQNTRVECQVLWNFTDKGEKVTFSTFLLQCVRTNADCGNLWIFQPLRFYVKLRSINNFQVENLPKSKLITSENL